VPLVTGDHAVPFQRRAVPEPPTAQVSFDAAFELRPDAFG
jgi:hypothetical protein